MTDTLKWVDPDGLITSTPDRAGYRMVYGPQAGWSDWLVTVLESATPEQFRRSGADLLARLAQALGGRIRTVPAPAEVFRIATADDIALAEAMLQAATDG